MAFVPNTDADRQEMLKSIGVNSFDDLIANIPDDVKLKEDLDIPSALSEYETLKFVKSLANKNITSESHLCFMGGGAYDHFIPAIVGSVLERPEFKTAYTPYQAEVSQGTLQAIFEFQSCICALTGMDVTNASQYDAGSSLAEACLLAKTNTRKSNIIYAGTVNPNYVRVTEAMTVGVDMNFEHVVAEDGTCNLDELKSKVNDDTAAVVVSQPNFLGNLEDVKKIEEIARQGKKTMFIVVANPMSLGILEAPGNYNADIVVGEGQVLGIPMNFGGPYLGLFSCKEKLVRKMPGRLSGITEDADGNRAFVLTLQTREQQIKREKATSNICSNQGLMMLASTVYMETMGKEGVKEVAEQCYQKANYLASKLSEIDGIELANDKPFFNEFVINTKKPAQELIDAGIEAGFLPGINVADYIKGREGILIAVTEKRTKDEMDALVDFFKKNA
jgi:glycine dehydrogenase subunit 1